jgi:hypothetical protein
MVSFFKRSHSHGLILYNHRLMIWKKKQEVGGVTMIYII